MQNNVHNILLAVVLIFSLGVRILRFDYPINSGETHRDYIIGRHIILYKELPLMGPCCVFNSVFGKIHYSPVYYYLVATVLTLKDNILFLGTFNIVLQIIGLLFVYYLAKIIFSKETALITLILFSFGWEVLRQSSFVWAPHLMHPFISLSYIFLATSYIKKSFTHLLFSIFVFVLASSVHNSGFAVLPAFILLAFLILKNQKSSFSRYVYATTVTVGTLLLFYLPWVIALGKQDGILTKKFIDLSPHQFSNKLIEVTISLFSSFNLSVVSILAITVGIVYLTLIKKGYNKKIYLLVLTGTITQFLILASSFKATIWKHYLTPVFPLFIILISEVINSVFNRKLLFIAVKLLIIFVLFKTITYNFRYISNSVYSLNNLNNFQTVKSATNAIQKEVLNIKDNEGYQNLDFFTIKSYAPNVETPGLQELVFWSNLEKSLQLKFLKVTSMGDLTVLNNDSYLFLICQDKPLRSYIIDECLSSLKYDQYHILKNIYYREPLSIYLAKKKLQ